MDDILDMLISPVVLIVILFLLAIGLAMIEDPRERKELDHYCEMVTIFKESNGEYGWPDFKRNYEEICNVR